MDVFVAWQLIPADGRAVSDIAQRLGLPRPVAILLAQRGCDSAEAARRFLGARGDVSWMSHFKPPPSMQTAAKRILEAKERGERVTIYGDYDADGVSGGSVLQRFFSAGLGLDAHTFLPSRFKEGYGLNARVIPELAADGTQLIVTTDNGITAVEAAQACAAHGIDLIVTDHHTAKDTLPEALALVHPKVDFPEYTALSGAGVAFMLCMALSNNDIKRTGQLLDLACIGTLGDMVPLTDYNRAIVHLGLKRWNLNNKRLGASAMLKAYNAAHPRYAVDTVTATDLGFVIAPLINAAGRMEHPRLAYELLTASDPTTADALAQKLVQLNEARKAATRELFAEISATIDATMPADEHPFIVLEGSGWHHGLVGLVAGKVLERYGRPVVILGDEEHEPDLFRGSGRAPKGVNLVQLLGEADRHMVRWGGHAQAAGCGVERSSIPALRKTLNDALRKTGWSHAAAVPQADVLLQLDDLGPALWDAVDLLEPFGQENPKPRFALQGAKMERIRVHKGHLFASLHAPRGTFEVVGWNMGHGAPFAAEHDLHFALERATDFRTGDPVLRLNLLALFPAHSRQRRAPKPGEVDALLD